MRSETRHSITLVAGTGVTAVLSLVFTAYVARVLGAEGSADFFAALSLFAVLQLGFGPINGTVARFTAQYAADGAHGKVIVLAREVTRRVARYGVIGLVIGLVTVKPLAVFLNFQSVVPIIVAFVLLLVTLLLSVSRGVLRGLQDFGQYALNTVAEAAVRLITGLLVFLAVRSVVGALVAYVLAAVFAVGLSRVQLGRLLGGHEPRDVDGAAVRRFTGPMFVMLLVTAGFQNIDMLAVKHYLLDAEAGVYGAAFKLAGVLGVLVTPFSTVLLPMLTSLAKDGRAGMATLGRLSSYFLLLAAPPVLVFWLWPEQIIRFVYASEFAGGAPLLPGLACLRLVGYLCHMVALAGAAGGRFGFLYAYVGALVAQVAGLVLWHESATTVVSVLLAVQTAALIILTVIVVSGLGSGAGSRGGARARQRDG